MGSGFTDTLRALGERLRGKGRRGPLSRHHMALVLDLADVRSRILNESDPVVRSFLMYALGKGGISRSQIFQDAFVLYVLKEKTDGFFCDFGSTDGVSLSNSYALERHFGWTGICAEPARSWHDDLRRNRPKALIETDCVWSHTGERLTFFETKSKALSTITAYRRSDLHARHRRHGAAYDVRTISLNDLLAKYNAPADFDYLSMDTEGSELEILKAFDMKRYRPKIITIEHNYTENRDAIFRLLTAHRYVRVLPEVSMFDDWYLAAGINLPEPIM